MIHLLICFTTPATTPLFLLAQSVIMVTYNPDNRYSDGFATPMVSDSQKSRKTLMRSALPSAVNRNGEASATPFLSPACFSTLKNCRCNPVSFAEGFCTLPADCLSRSVRPTNCPQRLFFRSVGCVVPLFFYLPKIARQGVIIFL